MHKSMEQSSFIMRRWSGFVVCIVAVLGCAVTAGCETESSGTATPADIGKPAIEVRTCAVQADSAGPVLTLSGLTEPVRRTQPAARIMARVLEAGFQEGDRVRAGQVLVRLDTRDLVANRGQAQTALATALTTRDVARLDLERMRNLHKAGTVARSRMEKMEVAHAQAEAAVAAAKSGRDQLDVNLSYAVASAPFSGVIVRKLVEEGAMVSPGQPLFIIEDDTRLRIVAAVGADLAAGLKPGQIMAVRIGGENTQAGIEGIIPSGLTQAPGLRVQLLIDNPARRFRSGTLATVLVPDGSVNAGEIMIPRAALVQHGRLTGAFVVGKDATAHFHWLVIGETRGDMVSVLSGLKEGDKVILHPEQAGVADGRAVKEIPR